MLSIGGATYTSDWDTALSQNPSQLGLDAAALASQLGVGIEIDYENGTSPNLTGLQAFVSAYRSQEPYDATGSNPAARLTIDLAAGDQYLTALALYATQNWLTTSDPVLDYANAMVANRQLTTSKQEEQWQEHVSGEPQYRQECSATCSGRRDSLRPTGRTPSRRTRAWAGSAPALAPTRYPSPCQHSGRADRRGQHRGT